jgi:2,5-dihydroxypyridine 5,6-dioxygenase
MTNVDEFGLITAANLIVRDFMCVQEDEQVVITSDSCSDRRGIMALFNAARAVTPKTIILTIPQMPFQGALSDPYIPQTVALAVQNCDVWLDLTFPYMSGSNAHAVAMKSNKVRCLQAADLGAPGIQRLFGAVDFDLLFQVQEAFDTLVTAAVGKTCQVTNARGTDVSFTIARPATRKLRRANVSGTYTPPGSAVIYPEIESVKGVVVLEASFHEYHTLLKTPIRVEVDGPIQKVSGGGSDIRVFERALSRASGGSLGSIIHFSHGFHPTARFEGRSFIEDIRAPGNDAVGFGIPWWQPGGGENHPDGVVTTQSMWIDGQQIVDTGVICGPPRLAQLERNLQASIKKRPVADAAEARRMIAS